MNKQINQSVSPRRIVAIDILRGFALLGILLMNIMSFAMPEIAYYNPTAYGGNGIWNQLVYSITHIVADQKFMAIFSLLFGAGVMLLTDNLERKGQHPARTHYIRNGWLLLFGLAHSILIWSGDILVVYALSALVLYIFRKLAPKWQFALGLLIFFLPSLFNVAIQSDLSSLDLTSRQALEAYWQPSTEDIAEETSTFRDTTYTEQVAYRLSDEDMTESTYGDEMLDVSFLFEFFARALGMMMIGMAFYTWGIVTAQRSDRFYWIMLVVGLGVGLPLALIGLMLNYNAGWDWQYSLFLGRIPNNFATPLIAAGYIAIIMLWSRRSIWVGLQERLAAVGRTALTSYISQSVLATFIFYGFGLGLYGSLDRVTQLGVIFLIWGIQLIIAPWWLKHFRYGPLEWVWRCLTYFRWQPLWKARSSSRMALTESK